jgi:hypothetical protein
MNPAEQSQALRLEDGPYWEATIHRYARYEARCRRRGAEPRSIDDYEMREFTRRERRMLAWQFSHGEPSTSERPAPMPPVIRHRSSGRDRAKHTSAARSTAATADASDGDPEPPAAITPGVSRLLDAVAKLLAADIRACRADGTDRGGGGDA